MPASTPVTLKSFSLGYLSNPHARGKLRALGGSMLDVYSLSRPTLGDGPCARPLLFWNPREHRAYLMPCASGKTKVCPSCSVTRKRRVRRVAHLGVLDRLASGGFLGLVTFTAPGDEGHRQWSVTGPSADRPVCGCHAHAADGIGLWNAHAAERWNVLRGSLAREYPGAQFYRAVEPQKRGALHLHVILWSPTPFDPVVLQALALRSGFGCNTRLDMCHGTQDGARFAAYVTKYVTKAIDDREDLPWEKLDTSTGELRSAVPSYRPWSQSQGFGVRMRDHLDAIRAQRRRHALALLENVTHALDALGATLIGESGCPLPAT